jgi:YgiT-type zinc finger domain-containing protein
MKCPICKYGNTHSETATVTLNRGATTLVFRQVPAEVCENCGEVYHSAEVTEVLLKQAEMAVAAGVEIDVRRFARVA